MIQQPFRKDTHLESKTFQKSTHLVDAIKSKYQHKSDLPNCYFHKQQKIIKFCQTKQCTLPLCNICQQIHISQHQKQHSKSSIKNYNQVKVNANQVLNSILNKQKQAKQSINKKVQFQKQKIIKIINQYFQKIFNYIQENTLPQQKIIQIQQKQQKIKKGSIKALIQFYSQDYNSINLKQPKIHIQSINENNLLNILRNSINIQANCNSIQPNRYGGYTKQSQNLKHKLQLYQYRDISNNLAPSIQQKLIFKSPIQKLGMDISEQKKNQQTKLRLNQKYQDLRIKYEPHKQTKNLHKKQQNQSPKRILQSNLESHQFKGENFEYRRKSPFSLNNQKNDSKKFTQLELKRPYLKNEEDSFKQANAIRSKYMKEQQTKSNHIPSIQERQKSKNRNLDSKSFLESNPNRFVIKQEDLSSKNKNIQQVVQAKKQNRKAFDQQQKQKYNQKIEIKQKNEGLQNNQRLCQLNRLYEAPKAFQNYRRTQTGQKTGIYERKQNLISQNKASGKYSGYQNVNKKSEQIKQKNLNINNQEQHKVFNYLNFAQDDGY